VRYDWEIDMSLKKAATVGAVVGLCVTGLVVLGAPPDGAHPDPRRQLDFWVGDWDVFLPDGVQAGTNRIELAQNGMAVIEHWSSARGGTGTSLNYFNTSDQKWKQVWVAASGWTVEMEGEFRDGAMRLEGDSIRGTEVKRHRTTLTPRADGTVHQHIEESADGGATWEVGFDGMYRRRAP